MNLPFLLRNRVKWSGLPFQEKRSSRPVRPPTDRGSELFEEYGLGRWGNLDRGTLDESLGLLDLLDRVPAESLKGLSRFPCLKVLDVGAKNWRYLPGLSSWLDGISEKSEVHGVELDAYRLYLNLRTRRSLANYYAAHCGNVLGPQISCTYSPGDVRSWEGRVGLVTWFFPFVSESPHRAWGLPKSAYDPRAIFGHVEERLSPGGTLVMMNQGDWEWERARSYFRGVQLRFQEVVEGSLHASPHPIFVTVWTRDA